MQQASVVGFLRTILIIIGIYYAFKFLARLLLPFLMRKMIQKFEKKIHNQQQQNSQSHSKPENKTTSTNNVGDYIDFEEIE